MSDIRIKIGCWRRGVIGIMEFRAAVFPHGLAERSEAKDDAPLRLLPHALRMASLQASHPWFRYMVLAPATTLHPFHDKSFGDIHKNMIAHLPLVVFAF